MQSNNLVEYTLKVWSTDMVSGTSKPTGYKTAASLLLETIPFARPDALSQAALDWICLSAVHVANRSACSRKLFYRFKRPPIASCRCLPKQSLLSSISAPRSKSSIPSNKIEGQRSTRTRQKQNYVFDGRRCFEGIRNHDPKYRK